MGPRSARANVNLFRQEIQKGPHTQRQITALADVDGTDFFQVAGIAVFEHGGQSSSSNVVLNLECGKACQAQARQCQATQCFAIAGLCVAIHRHYSVLTFMPQGPA